MTISEKVTCFLPCRQGSQRVPRKNLRRFGKFEFGLVEIKINQLIRTSSIDEIVLSTNDQDILEYARKFESSRFRIHVRSDELSGSSTSTDQLVAHALDLIDEGHILWTHVTSPFVHNGIYSDAVKCYREKLNSGYDSLMTTSPIQSFLWNDNGPLNYDRSKEKWPRTQTLPKLHEVNSAIFLASSDIYRRLDDRIGERPFLYQLEKLVAMDIDWQDDFLLAEAALKCGIGVIE